MATLCTTARFVFGHDRHPTVAIDQRAAFTSLAASRKGRQAFSPQQRHELQTGTAVGGGNGFNVAALEAWCTRSARKKRSCYGQVRHPSVDTAYTAVSHPYFAVSGPGGHVRDRERAVGTTDSTVTNGTAVLTRPVLSRLARRHHRRALQGRGKSSESWNARSCRSRLACQLQL